jgi:TRAP-type C4-dicarboxylate transport system permease large subunit
MTRRRRPARRSATEYFLAGCGALLLVMVVAMLVNARSCRVREHPFAPETPTPTVTRTAR